MLTASAKLQALRPRLSRICVALSGEHMLQRAGAMVGEFRFFEFRLDSVDRPEEFLYELGPFLKVHPQLTAIATCRRTVNGGAYPGTARDELHLLEQAAILGAHIVDVSLETAEETATNPHALAPIRRGKAALLLSWHDFQQTPDLEAIHCRMAAFTPDLYKIVPTAQNLRDSLALLKFLREHRDDGNMVAMAMGTPGLATRVLGPANGSVFTFASADDGSATAPGQLDARTLRDLYRIDRITPETRIYGVFGKPITGSKSPLMFNTAFREAEVDAVYLPLETGSPDDLFAAMHGLPLAGASVTMPLKETILPQLDALDPLAREIGAANTLVRRQNGTIGHNTDAAGILELLSQRANLKDLKVLILGAGGAARAAVFALAGHVASLAVVNRNHSRAEELATQAGVLAIRPEGLANDSGSRWDIIVNATPYGMLNQPQNEMPIRNEDFHCAIFFELVYNPVETPLLQLARSRGSHVIPGYEMFLAQGIAQFNLWIGKPAPGRAMRAAVLEELEPQATPSV